MDAVALLVAGAIAAAVILVVIGVFGSPGAARAVDRISTYPTTSTVQVTTNPSVLAQQTGAVASAGSLVGRTMGRALQRSDWSEGIARDLGRADLTLTPAEYISFRLAAVLAAFVIAFILGATAFPALRNPFGLVFAGFLGYLIPRIYVGRRQGARLRAFNDHLAETITLIANGLRAGSSLLQSLELVSRETRPPISTEFGRVVREVTIGLPLESALGNLVERVKSDDLELMSTAISIQYHVGGNLSEILDTIAATIRDRVRIKGEIRTLTAQQRLSGYVVGFLPVALLLFLMVVAPKFINPMFENPPGLLGLPLGIFLLATGVIMMLIGFALIRRIVDIEV